MPGTVDAGSRSAVGVAETSRPSSIRVGVHDEVTQVAGQSTSPTYGMVYCDGLILLTSIPGLSRSISS